MCTLRAMRPLIKLILNILLQTYKIYEFEKKLCNLLFWLQVIVIIFYELKKINQTGNSKTEVKL